MCVRRRVVRETIEVDPQSPIQSFLRLANEIPERLAAKTGGLPHSTIPEVLLGLPTTSTCWAIRGTSTRFETRRGSAHRRATFRVDASTAPTHA